MKKKFDNTDNLLGGIVKKVRQEKGLSQEALGKYVGLGKSSISKIESGKTNISADDASVLLEAMGEKLNIYIGDLYPSAETKMKQPSLSQLLPAGLQKTRELPNRRLSTISKRTRASDFLRKTGK